MADMGYSTWDGVVSTFESTMADNPTARFFSEYKRQQLAEQGPKLPKEHIQQIAKQRGVNFENIPDDGMSQAEVDFLADRQIKNQQRQIQMQGANNGMFLTGATALVAGIMDPLMVATDVLVSKGLASFTRIGAAIKAANGAKRLALRGTVGALEGGVAAAALEPFNLEAAKRLQDDYDHIDSLQNIAFGTVLGGGMHMGAGALSDAFRNIKAKKLKDARKVRDAQRTIDTAMEGEVRVDSDMPVIDEPNIRDAVDNTKPVNRVAEQLDRTDPKIREAYTNTSIAQLIEDRPVDVSLVREAEIFELNKKKVHYQEKINAAMASGDSGAVTRYSELRDNIDFVLEEKGVFQTDSMPQGRPPKDAPMESFSAKDVTSNDAGQVDQFKGNLTKRVDEAIKSGDRVEIKKGDADFIEIKDFQEGKMIDSNGNEVDLDGVVFGKDEIRINSVAKDAGNEFSPYNQVSNSIESNPINDLEGLKQRARSESSIPDSRYIDDEVTRNFESDLENPVDYERIETVQKQLDSEMADLEILAKQNEIEIGKILEDSDNLIKDTDDKAEFITNMAKCLTTRGF